MIIPLRRVVVSTCLTMVLISTPGAQQPSAPAPQGREQHAAGTPDHHAHRFDDVDALVKRFDDPARDAWQLPSRVVDALQIAPGEVVADIGAGTGYFTVRLARLPARPKVYAVDIEPAMVAHLRHRAMSEGLANVVAVKAASDRSNLPERVDVVLIVDTYHHIPSRVAYFTALRDQMKPGARLAIVDFRKGAPEGPPEAFRFTPAQIRDELTRAGFSLRAQHDFLPRQIFLIFTANR